MDDAAFWDKLARRYAASPIDKPEAYEATLALVSKYLMPDMRVLEMGCGTGTTALRLAPRVAAWHGTDLSSEMIAIAREKAAAEGAPGVSFSTLGAFGPPAPGAPHDAVLAMNLLHLVAGPLQYIFADLAARVRPGGLVITKTPALTEYGVLPRLAVPLMRLFGKAPSHVGFHSIADLDAGARAAGLEILETANQPEGKPKRVIVARRPQEA